MNRALTTGRLAPTNFNETDGDADGAEVELHRYQRQMRVLESERKGYAEEARTTITRQVNSIKSLRKENEYYQNELRLLQMEINDQGNLSKKKDILKDQYDLYQNRIKEITQELQNVDHTIAEVDRAITRQRASLGGVQATSGKRLAIQKQITALENRLDKALVRFNKALDSNAQLREQVDTLRHERIVFDNSYRKFERELVERKKQMAEIIEASTSAYEARDEAQARMIALKERAEKEYQQYLQEVKELKRQLEQDRKLKEFILIKTSERADHVVHLKKNSDAQATTKGSHELLAESMENYEKAFAKIKEVTQCENINELVKRFTQIEDQNFSLFNYVNEINNQIGAISEENAKMERRLNDYFAENSAKDNANVNDLKKLEEKLKATQDATQYYENQYQSMMRLQEDLEKGIQKMVTLFQKPGETIETLAAVDPSKSVDTAGARDNQLMAQLSLIEQKTSELLMKNLLLALPKKFTFAAAPTAASPDKKDGNQENADKSNQPLIETSKDPAALAAMLQSMINSEESTNPTFNLANILGQGPAPPITHLSFHAPTTVDDVDSEDGGSEDEERPLTRDEIRVKMLRSISKREKQASHNEGHGDLNIPAAIVSSQAKLGTLRRRRSQKAHLNR